MTIDEGGLSKSGSLANYVSGVFTERALQQVKAQQLKDAEAKAQIDQFIQLTAPLRTHFLKLAEPIEELLADFKVRELLEEGGVIINTERDKKFRQKYKVRPDEVLTGYFDYKIVELRPRIYEQVVSNPQPRKSFELEDGSVVAAEVLSEQENLARLIPKLTWYGLALRWENADRLTVPAKVMSHEWVEGSSRHLFWSVGAGDVYETTPGHFALRETIENAPIRVTRSFLVLGEREGADPECHLSYSHLLRRFDLRTGEQKRYNPQDSHKYLTSPQMIRRSDSLDVLKMLIGDDVVNEIGGKHEHDWWLFRSGTVPKGK